MQLTSTNVSLIVRNDIGNSVVIIDKEDAEELRNLLNDYLQMEKEGKI